MPGKKPPKLVFARTKLEPIQENQVFPASAVDSDDDCIWAPRTKTKAPVLLAAGILFTQVGHDKADRQVLRHQLNIQNKGPQNGF